MSDPMHAGDWGYWPEPVRDEPVWDEWEAAQEAAYAADLDAQYAADCDAEAAAYYAEREAHDA